ncbi:hypothetical protein N0V87_007235 [Didymella glomerata]|uniref:BTB domain-containing protein n=1 Tax=Didymella glomerata TaxID=749621 RepID=A0A9W9BY79_9PLEO|nr:hypothetical protein N0V87_007235 [Didymella glomerata]
MQSRYTSPPVTLRVGPDLESFYVPEFLLQSLNDLPRSGKTVKAVHLPDIDVDTAHIIVHFLHTAQYQTLHSSEEETASDHSKADFKKAIAAYIAAKKYDLAALQELARDSIFECAGRISLTQAAHGIGKDTLAAIQEDAGWLQDLVLRKVEQTFAESDEIFSSAVFFSGIESLELAKVLGQRVAELYRSRVRQLREQLNTSDEGGSLMVGGGIEVVAEQTIHQQDEVAIEDVPSASSLNETVKEEENSSQAIGNVSEVPCTTAETVTQAEPVVCAIEEVVSDAFVAVSALDTKPARDAEGNRAIPEPPSTSNGVDAWEATLDAIPRYPETIVSESAASLKAQCLAGTGPFEGISSKKERLKLMKKLRAKAAAISLEEREEAAAGNMKEEPRTVETEVEQETATPMQAVSVEEVPCNEIELRVSAIDSPAIDPFAGLSKSQRKKLEKKMKEEAAANEKQREIDTSQEVVIGSDLIEPEPDSAVDMAASDDESCPFRYEHLTQVEQWRSCSKCEAYMRKIAIKLHTAGLPDVNGLVAR